MVSRSQKIRLGIFITIGVLLLMSFIALLSVDRIFKEKDIYYIKYKNVSVSGLNVGSSVKYLGVRVGTVQKIEINPKNISEIIVTIAVNKGTPIKQDVTANISSVGITGLKIIELRGGTPEAPLLKPGGFIKPGKSLTEEITGKAEILAEKTELILNNLIQLTAPNNQRKIFKLVDETQSTVQRVNRLLSRSEPKVDRILTNLDSALSNLALASAATKHTAFALENMINSDTLRQTMRNIAEVVDKLNKSNIYHLDEQINFAVDRLNSLLSQMDLLVKTNSLRLNQSMEMLHQTIRYLNSAAQQIDEDPSVLIGGSKPENPPDDKLKN